MSVYPSLSRVVLATGAAALAAAAPAALLGKFALFVLPFALLFSVAHAFIVGLPAYLSLRRSMKLSYKNAAISGALVGAMPIGVMLLGSVILEGRIESIATMLTLSPTFGVFGAVGGVAFRRVVGST